MELPQTAFLPSLSLLLELIIIQCSEIETLAIIEKDCFEEDNRHIIMPASSSAINTGVVVTLLLLVSTSTSIHCLNPQQNTKSSFSKKDNCGLDHTRRVSRISDDHEYTWIL